MSDNYEAQQRSALAGWPAAVVCTWMSCLWNGWGWE